MSARPLYSFIAFEADDLPGQWIAHCLDIGVMSQGDSPLDAIESLEESVEIVLKESDLKLYHRADQTLWDTLESIKRTGAPMKPVEVDAFQGAHRGEGKLVFAGTLRVVGARPSAEKTWGSKKNGPVQTFSL